MQKRNKKIKFLQLFRAYIENARNPVEIDEVRSAATIKNYSVKYNNVTKFIVKEKLVRLAADDFDIALAYKLVKWCKAKWGHNYSVRTVEICECVLAWGYKSGMIKYNKLHALKLKKQKVKNLVHLDPEEVEKLRNYTGKRKYVADLFLFQCLTGMDYGDTFSVTKHHIKFNPKDDREYIIKPRLKTGIVAYIPYYHETSLLWSKYNHEFRRISNQKYNQYLKEIAEDLQIKKVVTTHTGRKTFACIKLNYEKYGIIPISKMLGHATVSTSEDYYMDVNLDAISQQLDILGV